MASTPTLIGYNNITIPSQDISSKSSTIATTPSVFDQTYGGYSSTSGYAGLNYDLIQTTTVPPGTINYTFSNQIYKSYMRKLDINFVAVNERPNRRVYPFFDGVDVSNLLQRSNIIEITGNNVFYGVVTPYIRNAANVTNGNINGTVDLTREQISIGNCKADIIYTELNANGNTVLYVGEFRGYTSNDYIAIGNTLTGVKSGGTGTITAIKHSSGVLSFIPTVDGASYDANTFVSSNTIILSSNGYAVVPTLNANTTYGLKLAPGASTVDNYYVGNTITLFGTSVVGETSNIVSYNAATRTISVSPKLTGLTDRSLDIVYSIGDGRSESRYLNAGNTQNHYTTSKGYLGGILRLPGYGVNEKYNFRVGKRLFRISDDANNDPTTASSIAEYVFCSFSIEEAQTIATGNSVIISTSSAGRTSFLPNKGKSPIAQSFFIDDADHPKGVFVPYIDMFFASKGTQPIEMQIRPIVNGYPDSYRILRNATTTLLPENVNVFPLSSAVPNTSNSSHYTRFTFPSPVYLQAGTEYAFLLVTNDYDYKVYASEVGGKILGTTRVISEQPYLGSLFKSQNSMTYNAIQSDDLMFVIHQCQFNTQGTVTFNEYKDPLPGGYPTIGVDSNTKMDMFSVISDAVQLPGTTLNYRYQAMTYANSTMDTDFTEILPDTKVFLEDKKKVLDKSFAQKSFILKIDMQTDDPDVSPVIYPERQELTTAANFINNMSLSPSVVKRVSGGNNYTWQNTSITFASNTGVSANGNIITGAMNINGNENYEKVISEIAFDNFGSGYYDEVNITLTSSDSNTTGANAAIFDVETELNPVGGPALARYISKTVTLAPEFDAGDLRVYLTAAKPPEANVQVYYKVRNAYDADDISSKNWVRMERKQGIVMDSVNLQPIEMEFRPSFTSNNVIYSSDTATFNTFNQFKIKIVLASSSTSFLKIPYVFDMRAIALPGDEY